MLKAWIHLFICTGSFCVVKIDMQEPSTSHYDSMWFLPTSLIFLVNLLMLPVSGPLLAARGKQDAAGFNEVALCSLTRTYRDEGIIVDEGQSDSLNTFIGCLFGMQKNTRDKVKRTSRKSATKIIGTFLKWHNNQKSKIKKTESRCKGLDCGWNNSSLNSLISVFVSGSWNPFFRQPTQTVPRRLSAN